MTIMMTVMMNLKVVRLLMKMMNWKVVTRLMKMLKEVQVLLGMMIISMLMQKDLDRCQKKI